MAVAQIGLRHLGGQAHARLVPERGGRLTLRLGGLCLRPGRPEQIHLPTGLRLHQARAAGLEAGEGFGALRAGLPLNLWAQRRCGQLTLGARLVHAGLGLGELGVAGLGQFLELQQM